MPVKPVLTVCRVPAFTSARKFRKLCRLSVVVFAMVLPGASARNVARNLRQYHGFSVLFAFLAGVVGLTISYYSGCSAGAAISLGLAAIFAVTFCLRKVRA